jgi:hypothetical protein
MSRDPLSVRRDGLVAQARDLVVWLRAWEGAEAALEGVGGGDILVRVDDLAVQADDAIGVVSRLKLRSPYVVADRVLQPIRDWAVEVRVLLGQAGGPDALTREVRTLIHDSFRRVAGSAAILRATLPRLEALVTTCGGEGRALVDRGHQLLGQLEAVQEDHDRWDAGRVAAAAAAKGATAALRGALRELRSLWRLARHRSGGALPALPLHLARSMTVPGSSKSETNEDGTAADET